VRTPGLQAAVDEAIMGRGEGGIPIGSALEVAGEIIGRGHNRRVQKGSAILHGEMDALENAGRLPARQYRNSVIYTTLSPCDMCTGAILLYEIPKVVIGENRTFKGPEQRLRDHGVEIEIVDDQECTQLMTEFIAENPSLWREDIGE
jgi:cytosine/creatinine deaminase